MAIQTIDRSPSMGATVGGALGGGLSGLLSGLAEGKAQKLMQRQQTSQLESLLGPEVAKFVTALPPESQKAAFQNIGSLMQLKESMSGQQPQAQQQAMPAQEAPFSPASVTPEQREQLRQYIGSPEASQAHTPQELAKLTNFLSQEQQPEQAAPVTAAQVAPKPVSDKAKLIEDIFTSPHEKREKRKLELDEEKIAQKERHFEKKFEREQQEEIKKTLEPLIAKKNAAEEALDNIKRREELETEGKGLDTAGYNEFLKRSGWDIPALRNVGSEEFNKSVASGVRGIKDVLGSKITQGEVQLWMQTLPSLSNSPAGRRQIDSTLKRFYSLEKAIADETIDIVRKNPGISPLDLLLKVDEKMGKKREAIAKQFKKDILRPVPEAQNKMVTAAQAGLGSLIGSGGKLAKAGSGAYTGYKLGQLAGPVGGGIGATLGALGGLLT